MTKPRPRRNQRDGVDATEILQTGMAPAEDCNGGRMAKPRMDALRKLWQEAGDRLTAEHIEASPNTRPWGWWNFNSRGREILDTAGRTWPLNVIGRAAGVKIRNRSAISAHEQEELLRQHELLISE